MSEERFEEGPGHTAALEELAVGWALHALEPADRALVDAHLPTCPRCRRLVDDTTEVMAGLAAAVPAADPPEGLRRRLRAAVAGTEQDVPVAAPVPLAAARERRDGRRRSAWTRGLVAAGVAAVVGLGITTVVLDDARDDARATATAQQQVIDELLRPGPATLTPVAGEDGRPVATVLTREDDVALVAHGLPANDRSATTYVLWGLGEGEPAALGTFDVTGDEAELRRLAARDAGRFAGFGISIEAGRAAPAAPTDVVASGEQPA
ncbi:anti-sigma factor [Blastococcus sp. TF02A-30]|uniref:anti-sigma factor n=1 Tax=Blastococcus sp. TF02A-30 TaxID=2250580 RepID=UPI000DEA159A|nr:anti-sigma factor [Blastococcus sp. TF02A-30]RBY87824.1 anti-sigma factor [Blastococcus sp. TF02A-30]